jgi:hypothetical protein
MAGKLRVELSFKSEATSLRGRAKPAVSKPPSKAKGKNRAVPSPAEPIENFEDDDAIDYTVALEDIDADIQEVQPNEFAWPPKRGSSSRKKESATQSQSSAAPTSAQIASTTAPQTPITEAPGTRFDPSALPPPAPPTESNKIQNLYMALTVLVNEVWCIERRP